MKKIRTKFLMFIALGLFAFTASSISAQTAQEAPMKEGKTAKDDKKKGAADIVDTAVAAGNFNTLAAALKAADLVDTLKGKGPFTVFAPTDEAFAKLPAGTVEDLLKPENKEKLKSILLYHVVSGKVTAKDAAKLNGKTAPTVQGGTIAIDTTSGVKINNATVVAADVKAKNGVIHAIDTVLMPSN